MTDFELELTQGVLEEAAQLLTDVEQAFLELEINPDAPEQFYKILRLAHSLKGSAKAVGFEDMGKLTHEMESLLLKVKKGFWKLERPLMDLLLRRNDQIRAMLDGLKTDLNARFDCSALLEEIQQAMQGASASPVATATTVPIDQNLPIAGMQANELLANFESLALNLFELPGTLAGRKFDIIFCRNVLIYFNREQIAKVGHSLSQHLHADGILCIGISETFNLLGIPLESVGPSIYRNPQGKTPRLAPSSFSTAPERTVRAKESEPSAVGPTITAKKVKALKPDLITLDIHMPEQDGVTYLARNYRPGHPPVVVVSSVSRDDAGLALETLRLGAADYIEKPKLEQLTDRADEIRSKSFSAATLPEPPSPAGRDLSLQASFAKPVQVVRTEEKLRIGVVKIGDQKKLETLLSKFRGNQPATWVVFEGSGSPVELLATRVRGSKGQLAVLPDSQTNTGDKSHFKPNSLVFSDLQSALKNPEFLKVTNQRTTGVIALSGVSDTAFFKLRGLVQRGFWVLNEAVPLKGAIVRHPGRRVSWTSLAYHAEADFPQEGTSD